MTDSHDCPPCVRFLTQIDKLWGTSWLIPMMTEYGRLEGWTSRCHLPPSFIINIVATRHIMCRWSTSAPSLRELTPLELIYIGVTQNKRFILTCPTLFHSCEMRLLFRVIIEIMQEYYWTGEWLENFSDLYVCTCCYFYKNLCIFFFFILAFHRTTLCVYKTR